MEITLSNCKICGQNPIINYSDGTNNIDDVIYPQNREKTIWSVNCKNNACCAYVLGNSEEEVINNWNNAEINEFKLL